MPVMNEVVAPNALFKTRYLSKEKLNLSAEDRLDVLDLVYMFEWAFDSRRFDALSEILTDDVVIDHIFGYREGKEAALEILRSQVTSNGLRHQATNPIIFMNEQGEVSVLSYLFVIKVVNESAENYPLPANLAHAVVTDVMRQENGRWKLARRTFEQMRVPENFMSAPQQRLHLEPAASQRAFNHNS